MALPILSAGSTWLLKVTTVSNANYTILTTDVLIAQIGTMSATRTFTLPTAAAFSGGSGARRALQIVDESGTLGLYSIVITASSSDKINGATTLTLTGNYANALLESDGVSKWTRIN